ncbi:hypothetical protein RB195_007988 [Necator americanus]|uniref:Nuclear receptor domain-containing protein n=1 Tax=Necator americanus TaxID=51031 RepID=A0ABR1C114_NECAM
MTSQFLLLMNEEDNARANTTEKAGSGPVNAKCELTPAAAITVAAAAARPKPDFLRIFEEEKNSATSQEIYVCAVCEEPARGFHFGAFTCEGCKSFFGRTCLRKNHERFECKNAGRCDVVGSNRTSCKACRYKRCVSVGMSPLNCRGVTFTGVIVPHEGQPNCLLVGCRGDSCDMNQRAEYADGLISVLINRTMVPIWATPPPPPPTPPPTPSPPPPPPPPRRIRTQLLLLR